jgi:hypothetical protein
LTEPPQNDQEVANNSHGEQNPDEYVKWDAIEDYREK